MIEHVGPQGDRPDQERARRFVGATLGGRVPFAVQDEAADALAKEFAAVRLTERRAIVAFLRQQAPTLLRHVIVDIEHGKHLEGVQGDARGESNR